MILCLAFGSLSACLPQSSLAEEPTPFDETQAFSLTPIPTPLPTRPEYTPGQLVEYLAQTGDTLPALAVHFNTTEAEIRAANPVLPEDVTTLPPGLPMQIPIYYQPLWGTSYQIIPDSLFVNGPAQIGFDISAYVNSMPGWLKNARVFSGGSWRSGAEFVEYIATNFSISPRLLLALLEYQTGALTSSGSPPMEDYPLGYQEMYHRGLNLQLVWAANTLNNGYYGWRTGQLTSFDLIDGRMVRPDPWQNAASVALQYYYAQIMGQTEFDLATTALGFAQTYRSLFGDPWENIQPHIPGSLTQPELRLPFQPGLAWAFTGGPHTGWGEGMPFAALDFAPPAVQRGCIETQIWATALADGVVARRDQSVAVLDLDGDGDYHTGWIIFYLHLASADAAAQGTVLHAGDPIGRPSCEGGSATGTHVHIARLFNGEWISADGPLPFDMEGWIAFSGSQAYQGTLIRFGEVVRASDTSGQQSLISSEFH